MTKIVIAGLTLAAGLYAGGFDDFYKKFGELDINKGYHATNKEIKSKIKKLGYYASTDEIKNALNGGKVNGKKAVVIDSRTKEEQMGLYLKGTILANLRGWNNAFNDEDMHSNKLGAVYSFCRTGTDQADNIVKLQWMFQGKAKTFGLKDMIDVCYPAASKSGKVLDAKLHAKGTYVQQAADGNYYEVNCPQVKDACTPIAAYTATDVEVAKDTGEKLAKEMSMKNKHLKQEVKAYLGADHYYYKKGCWN